MIQTASIAAPVTETEVQFAPKCSKQDTAKEPTKRNKAAAVTEQNVMDWSNKMETATTSAVHEKEMDSIWKQELTALVKKNDSELLC